MAFIEGRDVSSWNEDVPDFTASEFAIVKATEGSTYYNPKHEAQHQNAHRLELVVGHYHFINEHSPVADQVAWFLSKVPSDPDEFLALDWEVDAVSDGAKDEFLNTVMAARPHQRVLLYCNASFWARSSKFAGDGLWIAEWDRPPGDPNSKPWIIHQYTSDPYDKNVAAFESREAFADWVEGKAPSRLTHEVVEGDSVQHILDFYNITLAQLEEWNPQLLAVGRALLVSGDIPAPPEEPPPPPPPADPYANGLPVVGRDEPSAKPLQLELKRVGYLAASVPLADNYGPKTQAAVKAFYTANADQGFIPGIIIGPLGWAHLRTEETGSASAPPPPPPPPPGDGEPAHNYQRVSWSGKTVNVRTRDMLNTADRLLTAYVWDPVITQGSYNTGVGASAGTHDGGGVIDIRASTMTANGAWLCVQALRKAGFAAWYRVPSEGPWGAHIHAVAIGDREMSTAARNQVRAYFNGRNGLANNAPDSAPSWVGRPYPAWAAKYK